MFYKAVIIDDEKDGIELLVCYLEAYFPEIEVIGQAQFTEDLPGIFRKAIPDILFLDIKLIGLTGFDLLDRYDLPDSVHIIFVTGYADFALKAFERQATGYLLKPVTPEKFKETVSHTLKLIDGRAARDGAHDELSERYAIPTGKNFKVTRLDQILYCQADGAYTHFYLTNGKKITSLKSLAEVERGLDSSLFFRVHQSFLVNLNHIVEFDAQENCVQLTNQTQITVSRRQKKILKDWLKNNASGPASSSAQTE